MLLQINASLSLPIYAQIIEQIKLCLASGMITAGEQLPSIRELAMRLRINPNTVARAYRDLEKEGIVITARGKGVFVAERSDVFTERQKTRIVAQRLNQALVDAFHVGLGADKVRAILDKEIIKFRNRRSR